jgi:tRNA(Ile)-lysidine synthase
MITDRIKNTIENHRMLIPKDRVLIGLSGGADSSALTLVLWELREKLQLTLYALYIDHCLRPKETPQEIEHCQRLCRHLNIELYVEAIDVRGYCIKEGLSTQEGARELRYKCLADKAKELLCSKVALGHTAEDQTETVFMRIVRGTGVSGLAGIPPIRGMFIRPLIDVCRTEVEDYVISMVRSLKIDLSVPYIIESSNLKRDYLRNKIRLFLLPELKKANPSLVKTVSRLTEIVRDEEDYFNLLVTKTLMRLISRKGDGFIELFLTPMEAIDRPILRRVLRRAVDETTGLRGISFINIEEMVGLIKSGSTGARIYIGREIRVIKGYSTLIITSKRPQAIRQQTVDRPQDLVIKEAGLVLSLSEHELMTSVDYGDGKTIAVVDAAKVGYPLIIRGRQRGDLFYPLGLAKKKKLQDFFVDQKVPRDERDTVPLVTYRGEIVWVVGYRVDDRYKVDKETKRVLKFILKPLRN